MKRTVIIFSMAFAVVAIMTLVFGIADAQYKAAVLLMRAGTADRALRLARPLADGR